MRLRRPFFPPVKTRWTLSNVRKFSKSSDYFPSSEFKDNKFLSPWRDQNHSISEILRCKLMENDLSISPTDKYPQLRDCIVKQSSCNIDKITSTSSHHMTWMGHSSVLIQTDGVHILTDPVWGQRVSPLPFIGPKRVFEPPIEVEKLPLDVVLVSHTHYDHLDLHTVERIGNRALWIVPLGVKRVLNNFGVDNVIEMDWWQKQMITINKKNITTPINLEICCFPARHWSARTLFDRDETLWGSFSVKSSSGNYYFAGDTGYCPRLFATIGKHYGPFDLSLIPIGAYKPRAIHENAHCDPTEAIKMHLELQSKRSLAIHWGTYNLADDTGCEPAFELNRARQVLGVSEQDFFTMSPGECLYLDEPITNDISHMYPEECQLYVRGYNEIVASKQAIQSQSNQSSTTVIPKVRVTNRNLNPNTS